ncbi:MAG: folylpolyglutamate synthase/dihydrofolate synthase family protein [Pseudomonadota bacterium]
MPERSLGDWLAHLERIHPASIDLGLSRVTAVARELGLLPFTQRSLMIAGTNGKGSVAYSADALLRAHGLSTGRYTSPHLASFNERITRNAEPVADELILEAFAAIEHARAEVTLTYFEFATLAALWVFRRENVDVAILEIGLGGRLDAVNIVDSDVAVITAIDLDHQHWLGDTVDEIAPEKAAIARPGRPVVLAEGNYPRSLFATLASIGAAILRAGDEWSWREEGSRLHLSVEGQRLRLPVPEGLRPANVAAAVRASRYLLGNEFSEIVAEAALGDLVVPARCELRDIAGRELLIDVAHNPAAMEVLASFIKRLPTRRSVAMLGVMEDKDYDAMATSLADCVDGVCAVAIPGIARAAAPEAVWQALDRAGIAIAQTDFSLAGVWEQLLERTQVGDRIVVCGSFYTVAGILALLRADSSG